MRSRGNSVALSLLSERPSDLQQFLFHQQNHEDQQRFRQGTVLVVPLLARTTAKKRLL